MGVLRYFPGSEPPEQRTSPEPERSGPGEGGGAAEPDHEAVWAVPVLGPDGSSAPEREQPRASRRAENVSLAALTRHDASEAELRTRLASKGLDEETVEAELERLKAAGLVDDAALADRLVRSLRERKGLGDGALRPALKARHLPQSVIDAAIAANAEDDEVVEERLQDVADDRARRLASLPDDVAERRLTAYLLRRGYGGSSVRAAVKDALERARRD
ncbi:MAG: regulatory protein RecX [Amnibacterium sp.]